MRSRTRWAISMANGRSATLSTTCCPPPKTKVSEAERSSCHPFTCTPGPRSMRRTSGFHWRSFASTTAPPTRAAIPDAPRNRPWTSASTTSPSRSMAPSTAAEPFADRRDSRLRRPIAAPMPWGSLGCRAGAGVRPKPGRGIGPGGGGGRATGAGGGPPKTAPGPIGGGGTDMPPGAGGGGIAPYPLGAPGGGGTSLNVAGAPGGDGTSPDPPGSPASGTSPSPPRVPGGGGTDGGEGTVEVGSWRDGGGVLERYPSSGTAGDSPDRGGTGPGAATSLGGPGPGGDATGWPEDASKAASTGGSPASGERGAADGTAGGAGIATGASPTGESASGGSAGAGSWSAGAGSWSGGAGRVPKCGVPGGGAL